MLRVEERATLRIVIPTETYPPEINGAGRFTQRLAESLAARGHEIHVIAPAPDCAPSRRVEGGVTVHRIRAHRWYPHPSWTISMPWNARREIPRIFDEVSPELIHVQAHFLVGRYGIKEAQKCGIPIVVTNHFVPENVKSYVKAPNWILRIAADWAWKDLRKVFAPAQLTTMQTDLSAKLLRDKGYAQPIKTVSCGIEASNYEPTASDAAARSASVPTALFVGRLAREKHVDNILFALAKMQSKSELRAIIVGAGDQLQPLNELANRLNIADRVEFRQHVPEDQLRRLYAQCSFFCMPSTAELQCLACLEAMAAGRPIVAARALALPHLVEEGVNGYLFEPGDVAALSAIFERLASANESELSGLGQASRNLVRKHDISRTVDIFESEYARLIETGSRART